MRDDMGDLGQPYGGHGDVYRWLRENYEFVKAWREGRKPSWKTVAEKMGEKGVVGSRGAAPTERSIWKVWQRVCRDVAAEREREAVEQAAREALAERRRNYPSRQPAAGPSMVEATGRALVPVGAAQTAVATTTAAAEKEKGKEEKVADARRKLECLSGLRPMSEF
ncbi:hypothetical protein [Methylosinus sp. LW3]|uniref:hypothetical protein n=1 Tax=Methylosinus sp. LW3 TaxID=107635 RepID=UPI000462EC99|nr:hypothetical protein [Methylosinus sp. LW3]